MTALPPILAGLMILALFGTASTVEAQRPAKLYRVGLLATALRPDSVDVFRLGMRDRGYVEGVHFALEVRDAEARAERLPGFAHELVAAHVDVIVTIGTQAAEAAKVETRKTPIVLALASDAVGTGLVSNIARPAGNVTGLTMMMPDISAKRLQLVKQAFPKRSSVTVLWNSADPPRGLEFQEVKDAARTLGMTVRSLEIKGPTDLDRALMDLTSSHSETVIALADPLTNANRKRVVDVALKSGTVVISSYAIWAESGALMSFGPDLTDLTRRAAVYVDKIFRGAKPSDLPIEQPTRFELVINRKTAKALGLTIPPSVLERADHVVE